MFANDAPEFFQKYKRKSDQRNILHFAALASDENIFLTLSVKYKQLLDDMDALVQRPLDLLIQRTNTPSSTDFFFDIKFITLRDKKFRETIPLIFI